MSDIKPKLVNIDPMIVVGFEIRTTNRAEMDPSTAKIPGLWQRFYQEKVIEQLKDKSLTGMPIAVYSKYETDHTGPYNLLVGTQIDNDFQSNSWPNEMNRLSIAAGKYLLFTAHGPMPQIVIETWQTIWDYFAHNSQYQRVYTADFELYSDSDTVEIYIAIK